MKRMKKILLALMLILVLGIALISCKAAEKCPAYGEAKKFQVEQNY